MVVAVVVDWDQRDCALVEIIERLVEVAAGYWLERDSSQVNAM